MSIQPHIKTALFVDFDNIYLGLKNLDEDAAERFASEPGRWLEWMVQGMPSHDRHEDADLPRRDILIRRCYLNPRGLHRYRPYFTRSAFSVIDCPPLTAQNKNSADIHMVMDILDTLEHKTRFDEFIILSGDADFTPVLLRLRSHDRRTAILTVGPAAEAYKAACDVVISEDAFIEYGLGMASETSARSGNGAAAPVATASQRVFDAMSARLYEEASTNGEVLATHLPRLYREFTEFRRDSNWLGYYSLRALTAELARRRPELRVTEGDPWRVTVRVPQPVEPMPARRPEPSDLAPAPTPADALSQLIVQFVQKLVAASPEPILMAKAAHEVIQTMGPQVVDTHWAGSGTFKNLLQSAGDLGFQVATTPGPGYLYDPDRHDLPEAEPEEPAARVWPAEMIALAQKVSNLTGAPDMRPEQYAVLFMAIADELRKNRYSLTSTSKAVRDLCIERGESTSRADVSFVLKGIAYAGHRFHRKPEDDSSLALAKVFRNSVITRCQDAELELTPEEKKLIDVWILGGLSQK